MDNWEIGVREMVRQTLSDCTAAADGFDLRALSECFAPDGVLEFTGGAEPLIGPAEIRRGLAAATGPQRTDRPTPTHVRHHVASVRFGAVTPERAEVSSYFAVHTDVGLDHWGTYTDVLVPVGPRWLFARRRIVVDAFAPDSLMAPGEAVTS